MKQEIFKFNFKFRSKDFFVSKNNFNAFNLIEKWPNWENKFVYVYGPKNCGKTTISRIWSEKSKAKFLNKKKILNLMNNDKNFKEIAESNWVFDNIDKVIEENKNSFEESILNFINILSLKKSFFFMTGEKPPRFIASKLQDLISRLSATLVIEVKEPNQELLMKIIKKYLKDRNISLKEKYVDFIINRIERTYSSALNISKLIDNKSLEKKSNISHKFLADLLRDLY